MSSNLSINPDSLPYVHCYRFRVFFDLLDTWSALAQTVSSVVVYNDIDSIFDVKVQQICVVLDLFSIFCVRTAQNHSWLTLVINCLILCLIHFHQIIHDYLAWNPVAMDSLMVVSSQEDCLGLWISNLHLCSKLLKCTENLEVHPSFHRGLEVSFFKDLVDEYFNVR